VNRRGSAANDLDVPLADAYKVDDRQPGFAREAASKIRAIMSNFDRHSASFEEYRRTIAAEPARFREDAKQIFLR
jgi:hypothetical protein